MTAGSVEVEVAGERLWLLPQRAVWWAARRTLVLADVHLGKMDAARALGAPVGERVLRAALCKQLEPWSAAVRATEASRVLVVGDLLHAPAGITPLVLEVVGAWRETIGAEIDVIPGNHDRRLRGAAAAWRMSVMEESVREGPFEFTHYPREPEGGAAFVWCGHLHPAVDLARGGDSLRLPAFHLTATVGVLPAFTPFAPGGALRVSRGDRLYAIAAGRVVAMG